ncbi:hypothetical protein [Alteromonas sp. a30]|uniref:hypothetical protein n=1 Tax=Alteromonas sp. a30 TaxID=2730917 RepID=UPI002282C845|nr:hypothetical protein [Alteromonas sp. a30]MCY7296680.1 hypothetical protein [Alteromonas sp. a30]
MLILLLTHSIAFLFILLGVAIFKIAQKPVQVQESPEAMYERAARWQQEIIAIEDIVERVQEDEKWCQYVKKIKGRKNGLREV